MGLYFDDELRAFLILYLFSKSYNSLVITISNYASSYNKLVFEYVMGILLLRTCKENP